jgi:hypothetical protein
MPAKKLKKAETVYDAVEQQDIKRLVELIQSGADVNESEEDTPLAKAAELGRADMVRELFSFSTQRRKEAEAQSEGARPLAKKMGARKWWRGGVGVLGVFRGEESLGPFSYTRLSRFNLRFLRLLL